MAKDPGWDQYTRRNASVFLSLLDDIPVPGLRAEQRAEFVRRFNAEGPDGLVWVPQPRGDDFSWRFGIGVWAEQLVHTYLDGSTDAQAVPYGTTRGTPFRAGAEFEAYMAKNRRVQASPTGRRWKRPDLLTIPRQWLTDHGVSNPQALDLTEQDAQESAPFLAASDAGFEVEMSLWHVARRAAAGRAQLSFTVKDEDLAPLRAWVELTEKPLYIIQVFYDVAYALSFAEIERVTGPNAPAHG